MRVRQILVAAAMLAATAFTVGTAGPVSADVSTGPEPWEPIQQEEWTAPAGRYCDFPLHVDVQFDTERTRVLERYPDGTVKRREYIGALISDFVNVDTGARHRSNSSAQGFVDFRPDGTWERFSGHGPFGFGFRATDPYPRGYYELTGYHVIEIDPDGTKHMVVDNGDEENVCEALD